MIRVQRRAIGAGPVCHDRALAKQAFTKRGEEKTFRASAGILSRVLSITGMRPLKALRRCGDAGAVARPLSAFSSVLATKLASPAASTSRPPSPADASPSPASLPPEGCHASPPAELRTPSAARDCITTAVQDTSASCWLSARGASAVADANATCNNKRVIIFHDESSNDANVLIQMCIYNSTAIII